MVTTLRWLKIQSIPASVALLFLLPIGNGLFILLQQAGQDILADIADIFTQTGIWQSWLTTLWVGLASTLATGLISCFLLASMHTWFQRQQAWRFLSVLIAIPHLTLAMGLALLFLPSGFFLKLLSPWLTHLTHPPTWNLLQDPWCVLLIFCLICKEIPFLLVMAISSINWYEINQDIRDARSLGYSAYQTMWKIVFPQTWHQLRLPLYAISAYSLSVVDVSLLIGPNTPAPFAVTIWQWHMQSDPQMHQWATQGALLLCASVAATLLLLRVLEWFFVVGLRTWQLNGTRKHQFIHLRPVAASLFGLLIGIFLLTFAVLLLWSVAQRWPFPQALPTNWTLTYWQQMSIEETGYLWESIKLATCSAGLSLLLVIAFLEYQHQKQVVWPAQLICFPLFIPQIAILFGVQIFWLKLGLDHGFFAVLWGHCLFVFPYIYLSLQGTYHAYDIRYTQACAVLGKTRWQCLLQIKWPMLAVPIATAYAVGFHVSFVQYLPTLLLGGGRISTITTEIIVTGGYSDPQFAGIYACWQTLFPALVYIAVYLFIKKRKHSFDTTY